MLLELLMVVSFASWLRSTNWIKIDPVVVGTLNIVQIFVSETSLKVHNLWFDKKSFSLVNIHNTHRRLLLVWVTGSVKQNKTHWPTLSQQQRHQHNSISWWNSETQWTWTRGAWTIMFNSVPIFRINYQNDYNCWCYA